LAIRRVPVVDKDNSSVQKRMNPTFAPLDKNSPHIARQVPRVLVAMLCVLLTAAPSLADTVQINQVVQTLTSSQGAPGLKLNTFVSQDPVSRAMQGSTPRNENAAQSGPKADPIVVVTGEAAGLGVEMTEEGEVEGTICDCGEILVAGGAFPKWPLLFLVAVPLVFIHDCDDCDETPSSTPTPTPPSNPTPTPTPTPEPASLLLFGSGLVAAGAGLRRRYARAKLAEQLKSQEDE
jgi:PEP-CTERM motif